jgi:hypothetical protein
MGSVMSLMLGLVLMYVGLLWAAVIWILKLAADKEYPYWAPRLAERLIRTASLLLPRLTRAQRREEWLAELDAARAEGGVLTLGSSRCCRQHPA